MHKGMAFLQPLPNLVCKFDTREAFTMSWWHPHPASVGPVLHLDDCGPYSTISSRYDHLLLIKFADDNKVYSASDNVSFLGIPFLLCLQSGQEVMYEVPPKLLSQDLSMSPPSATAQLQFCIDYLWQDGRPISKELGVTGSGSVMSVET